MLEIGENSKEVGKQNKKKKNSINQAYCFLVYTSSFTTP